MISPAKKKARKKKFRTGARGLPHLENGENPPKRKGRKTKKKSRKSSRKARYLASKKDSSEGKDFHVAGKTRVLLVVRHKAMGEERIGRKVRNNYAETILAFSTAKDVRAKEA